MVDKINTNQFDGIEDNVSLIERVFPECITESRNRHGSLAKCIDFERLKQLLSADIVDGQESYEFTWVGKKESITEATRRTDSTLRPCKKDSKNWDITANIYLDGDNLEILKVLQESYLGKIKIIYIDPPYNTGNDFIYHDSFKETTKQYEYDSEYIDYADDNRLVRNSDTNGRFHSDWCSMIYSRLMLSRTLLTDDGVIFISIGQEEMHNLTSICNELFGEENHVGTITRIMKSGGNKGQFFSPNVEYILVYAKSVRTLGPFREAITDEIAEKSYKYEEQDGDRKGEHFSIKGLCQPGLGIRPNQRYWVECPDGSFVIPRGKNFPNKLSDGEKVLPTSEDTCWRWSADRYLEERKKGTIFFAKSSTAQALVDEKGNTAKWNVFTKSYLSDRQQEGRVPVDIIQKWENRVSSQELKSLNIPFDFAKPVNLIKYLISLVDSNNNATVLDFFSGSATTAHAVMQLNAEDGGNRKFIMVQLPEKCDENSEAYKAGYKTICDIGKERIRRAAKKISEEHPDAKFDDGFRVFKVDSSNMTDVGYTADGMTQDLLSQTTSNIKADRTDVDLLFDCLLKEGVEITYPYSSEQIDGCTVHDYNNGALIACFDENVSEIVMRKMAEKKPIRAIFRDSSFKTDADRINVEELFKLISPDTTVKVI